MADLVMVAVCGPVALLRADMVPAAIQIWRGGSMKEFWVLERVDGGFVSSRFGERTRQISEALRWDTKKEADTFMRLHGFPIWALASVKKESP